MFKKNLCPDPVSGPVRSGQPDRESRSGPVRSGFENPDPVGSYTSPLRTRLYFNKDDEIFCHVVFAKNLDGVGLKPKEFYYLEGWQKKDTRRNCLIIYESIIPQIFDYQCFELLLYLFQPYYQIVLLLIRIENMGMHNNCKINLEMKKYTLKKDKNRKKQSYT